MGVPSPLKGKKKVVCVGGGLGVAPIYPQARGFKENGAYVIGILGFRTKNLIFWDDKFRACCDEVIICTDDGSAGIKGFVSDGIKLAMAGHKDIDEVVAIGPPIMMKACAETTRPAGIKTIVSLNPIMVDGTGMCGGCRVKIGDEIKFACVDGPDFDGHKVDFNDLMMRLKRYAERGKGRVGALVGKLPDHEHDARRDREASEAADPAAALPDPFEEALGGIASPVARDLQHGQEEKDDSKHPAAAHPGARAGRAGAGEEFRRSELRLYARAGAKRSRALPDVPRTGLHRRLPGQHQYPEIHRGDHRQEHPRRL